VGGRADEPHLDGPGDAGLAATHGLLHPGGLGEEVPGGGKQSGAAVGQLDAAAGAAKELHAEASLQSLDLLAERRLRDAEACGRASEVQLLGDRDEVAQMSEVKRF
jgi:hypothetical protein